MVNKNFKNKLMNINNFSEKITTRSARMKNITNSLDMNIKNSFSVNSSNSLGLESKAAKMVLILYIIEVTVDIQMSECTAAAVMVVVVLAVIGYRHFQYRVVLAMQIWFGMDMAIPHVSII